MRPTVARLLLSLLAAVAVAGCASAGPKGAATGPRAAARGTYEHEAFGRTVRLTVHAASRRAADEAAAAAIARLAALDAALNGARGAGAIGALHAGAGGPWQKVDDDLFFLLQQSRRLSAESGGAFDATAGPVAALWRERFAAGGVPSAEEWLDARAPVGWRMAQFDAIDRRGRLVMPGMRLDFGDLAVAYAADEMLKELARRGVAQALVDAGSVRVAADAPPRRPGWAVKVPPPAPRGKPRPLLLRRSAVATWGDGQQVRPIDDRPYSDRVDPRTGLGAVDPVAITVVGPTAFNAARVAALLGGLGPAASAPLAQNASNRGFTVEFRTLPATGAGTRSRRK